MAKKTVGELLVETLVELSTPPTIELKQALGFSLYMAKAVLNGRADEGHFVNTWNDALARLARNNMTYSKTIKLPSGLHG
jgi:hypothetical protein